jgi:hypothetical protein
MFFPIITGGLNNKGVFVAEKEEGETEKKQKDGGYRLEFSKNVV